MGLMNGFLNILTNKQRNSDCLLREYIFYKIVNYNKKLDKYLLQCINTKATFLVRLNDIISDEDILHRLHPIQACYVGIEYAISIKKNKPSVVYSDKMMGSYSYCRYGTFSLRHKDRKKNLCFVDLKTKNEFLMDPRDIALSEHFIIEFDAIQAFYIGLLAGFKMNTSTMLYKKRNNNPRLVLIKR